MPRLLMSRQSIHKLEKRIQAVPTWLVALVSIFFLSILVVIIMGSPKLLLPNRAFAHNREILSMLLENAEAIAIMVAVILYVKGAPDRKTQKHYEAWRVIDTAAAANVTTSYARFHAITELHRDGVPLKWLEAPKANLTGISLPKANLEACNLAGANLENANLRGANLSGANLSHADLVGANLTGANLRAATLRSTLLWSANLWEADLSDAEMRWADLHQEQLSNAVLEETILPDGKRYDNFSSRPNPTIRLTE